MNKTQLTAAHQTYERSLVPQASAETHMKKQSCDGLTLTSALNDLNSHCIQCELVDILQRELQQDSKYLNSEYRAEKIAFNADKRVQKV